MGGGVTLQVARPELGPEEAEAVARVLATGWVTQGPEVARFEAELAAFVGAPEAVATSSCTTALHLALLAVGVGPGDEVVCPSHSFIATANAVRQCGATPVFADVDLDTFNLDPDDVARRVGPRTRALLVVHQLGLPCDLEALLGLARARGLPVVEDAACAIGSEVLTERGWERIGRPHGDLACFSFHPRKLVTTGDGGAITTRDPAVAARLRRMRQHGMTVTDAERHKSASVVFEAYEAPGFNYRLTDLQAAVGRVQLGRLPAAIAHRRALAGRYRERLHASPEVACPVEPSWARTNWQSYCVRLTDRCARGQREVMEALLAAGVSTRRGVMCAHLEPAYAGAYEGLGRSERARDRGLVLPLHGGMGPGDVDRVCDALLAAVRGG
ncbi:MAG: DegT/DnrJ/EryC1/StrS family aminotransferase [Planctomycetes bacterium]|nr:DegT/DnrJ/EryC1/StrS family aminotransferase [Planctomycetota bacterium]